MEQKVTDMAGMDKNDEATPEGDADTTETLELARAIKQDQGYHEVEVCVGGESDLHRSFIMCDKNPGHKEFIPIKEFTMAHLPPLYHDNDIVDLIRAQSDLTVRISVKVLSGNRPERFPDSDQPFPFFNHKGSKIETTGSGWVNYVLKYTTWNNRNCRCPDCRLMDQPRKARGMVYIQTAAHVVCDSVEAKHATCYFFYDTPDTDLKEVLSITDLEVEDADTKRDWCKMRFETHDEDLIDKLYAMWHRYEDLHTKVYTKYEVNQLNRVQNLPDGSSVFDPKHKLTFITAHPHGCSKQITIGHWTDRQVMGSDRDMSLYTYTTPTCNGSSGAPVYILGRWRSWFWCNHPHSAKSEVEGLNRCGFGFGDKPPSRSIYSPLLEDFRNDQTFNLSLKDLVHHVVEFSRDEFGARFIQQELEHASVQEKSMVFDEILPTYFLMMNEFGHGVFQKVFEVGLPAQKQTLVQKVRGCFPRLIRNKYGCRVIRKALESIPRDMQAEVVKTLEDYITYCMRDEHGSQVILTCFEQVDPKYLLCIFDAVKGQVVDLAVHEHGNLIIQSILELNTREQTEPVLKELYDQTFRTVRRYLLPLSRHKFGSDVVRSCLDHCPVQERALIILKLCDMGDRIGHGPALYSMMKDEFAHRIVLAMINTAEGDERDMMMDKIRPFLGPLCEYTYGRQFLAELGRFYRKTVNADVG